MSNLRYPVPKAIFFDFDGVVLDSANIKTEAFGLLFKAWPQHQHAIRSYHLQHMGVSRFHKFEWIYKNLIGREISEVESQQLGAEFSSICIEQILAAPFIPGAQRLLAWCQKHCFSFIASGTPEEELKMVVAKRELLPLFQEVCGTPRRKDEIVRQLLQKYSLAPHECWFIGDAPTDQEAAKETGLHFLAVNSPEMKGYWLRQTNCWLVNSLDEVAHTLEWNEDTSL